MPQYPQGQQHTNHPPSDNAPITLHVRFATGLDDLPLTLPQKATIADLHHAIKSHHPPLSSKFLRLVFRGRVLRDTERINTITGPVTIPQQQPKDTEGDDAPAPTYIHCVVSELPPSEEAQHPQLRPTRGFDRLLEIGFTPEEVQNVRSQFHTLRGTD
ncbi:hypothetical protein HK097_004383, partial [Rhizophlyctis rosea]